MRSVLYAEAERQQTTPSRLLEELLVRHLPDFIASGLRQSFAPVSDEAAHGGVRGDLMEKNERRPGTDAAANSDPATSMIPDWFLGDLWQTG
jgi:hypothetical protein